MGEVPDDVLEVPVVLEDGQDVTGPLHLWEEASGDSDEVRLTLLYPGGKAEARGANFFRALQSIRRGLEPNGVRLRCLGACRDVYPSPMIEDMGPAEKAYRLTMGDQRGRRTWSPSSARARTSTLHRSTSRKPTTSTGWPVCRKGALAVPPASALWCPTHGAPVACGAGEGAEASTTGSGESAHLRQAGRP